jgi:hypothetical protein
MATLSVSHTEIITINNTQYGGTNSFTIDNISNVIKRVITVAANNDTTLASFHSDQHDDDGTVDVESVKYIRLTNLDASNLVNINFQIDSGEDDSAADESASFQLLAGQSFVMGDADDCVSVDDDAATPDLTMHPLESIIIDSGANSVQMEMLIATV